MNLHKIQAASDMSVMYEKAVGNFVCLTLHAMSLQLGKKGASEEASQCGRDISRPSSASAWRGPDSERATAVRLPPA